MRTFSFLSAFTLVVALVFSQSLSADPYAPVPHCYKPLKPLMLTTFYYKKRFQEDVSEYRICLKNFIKQQDQFVSMHQKAGKNAQAVLDTFGK